jgi:hypothetical protein
MAQGVGGELRIVGVDRGPVRRSSASLAFTPAAVSGLSGSTTPGVDGIATRA